MAFGLITSISMAVAGIGAIIYLFSGQPKSKGVPPPEWIKDLRGQKGVIFTGKGWTEDSHQPAICERISDIFGKKESREYPNMLKNSVHDWVCDNNDDEESDSDPEQTQVEKTDNSGSEKFYGFYFEDNTDLGNCNALQKSEDMFIYLDQREVQAYKGSEGLTTNQSLSDECVKTSDRSGKSFLSGNQESLSSSSISAFKKINLLQLLGKKK